MCVCVYVYTIHVPKERFAYMYVLGVADFASRGADFATRVADFATRTSMSRLFQGAGQVRELEGSVFQVSPIDPCRGSLVIFSKEVKFR